MSTRILTHMLLTLLLMAGTVIAYALHSGLIRLKPRGRTDREGAPEATFSPVTLMRWLIVPMFASLCIFFYPIIFGGVDQHTWFTSALESVMQTVRAFSFGVEIGGVWTAEAEMGEALGSWDRAWGALLLTLTPALTLSAAVTLFRGPRLWLMLWFSRTQEICIFSKLNARAEKYAKALRETETPPFIVFCGEPQAEENAGRSLVIRRDVCNLRLPRKALPRISFYLVAEDDNIILDQAGCLQSRYGDRECHIYCVSSGRLDEYAIDQMNRQATRAREQAEDHGSVVFTAKGQLRRDCRSSAHRMQTSFVEVINETQRIVYRELYDHPLITQETLEKVLRPDGASVRTMQVLVLGCGAVGETLARTLLWYGQLPDVRVCVTLADRESDAVIRGRVFRSNLRFEELCAQIGYGDRARLAPAGGIDFCTVDLENLLDREQWHAVMIAAGDDDLNNHLALRVRRQCLRHPAPWGYPDIRTVIWNDMMTKIAADSRYIAMQGARGERGAWFTDYTLGTAEKTPEQLHNPRCRVQLMGAMGDTLMVSSSLEFDALRYHARYDREEGLISTDGSDIAIARSTYYGYWQSSRSDERSNWAAAMHGRIKFEWNEFAAAHWPEMTEDDRVARLAECEHIRWCIFKILEGDAPVPDDLVETYFADNPRGRDEDTVRGYHVALRRWEDLAERAKAGAPDCEKWRKKLVPNESAVRFALRLVAQQRNG